MCGTFKYVLTITITIPIGMNFESNEVHSNVGKGVCGSRVTANSHGDQVSHAGFHPSARQFGGLILSVSISMDD